ncbi:unnamed protein product [Ceutorhynchus assimilis]|uniref:Mediator of RNA polymerase II transcription subunit 26 n=1 Tax=Ceutorhynchus assimilis TaxID=467358 RepID=A0A9N9MT00_9CUCU|nr:unnamed protein product [Ceutorhynchus assimilis]
MQNNVIELTQRLLRALDSNYNVTDMPEVVDIICNLERVAITKELLETTRLGKYINELRRKTNNQELWRRAKELLKKWRSMVLPEVNGQIKVPAPTQPGTLKAATPSMASPPLQGQGLRIPPASAMKVSPPMMVTPKMVSPSLQNRLVGPGVQKLVSPAPRLISPGQRLVSPAQRLVSPQISKKLVSPHNRMVSPGMPVEKPVSPQKMVSPAGQRVSPKLAAQAQSQKVGATSPPLTANADVNLNQVKSKKRQAGEALDSINAKRSRLNGGVTDLDFSDNSNCSFKDGLLSVPVIKQEPKQEVVVINSDSNSSFQERGDPYIDQLQPKKRGRKKGSKNHKNLIDEAETSFTNKLAVSASRGSSKVKTTQEILAGIQSKHSVAALSIAAGLKPPKEDLEEKAAKLTERVSMIDRKLNANANRNKNSQKNKLSSNATKSNERVIESGSVINDRSLLDKLKQEHEDDDDEEIIVDDIESLDSHEEESQETDTAKIKEEPQGIRSLSEKEALALLPPIDRSVLNEMYPDPPCTCRLKENSKPSAFSIGDDEDEDAKQLPPFQIIEDPLCPAKGHFAKQYRIQDISEEKIHRLHEESLPNMNGNWSLGTPRPDSQKIDGLYVNVVPNIYERLDKDLRPFDSFKKYSFSEGEGATSAITNNVIESEEANSDSVIIKSEQDQEAKVVNNSEHNDNNRTEEQKVFREWYECVDRSSYSGETLRILPYCIVD